MKPVAASDSSQSRDAGLLRHKGRDEKVHSATMSDLTPSFYDANTGLFQLSRDAYDLWYQQGVDFYEYEQHQEPTQPVNDQHRMEPNQQLESYVSYDQTRSNTRRNHVPSPSQQSIGQLQKTPSRKTMHVLLEDRNVNSNRNGDNVFKRRPGACTRCKQVKMKCDFAPGEQTCQRCKLKGYRCVVKAPKPRAYARDRLLTEIRQKDAIIETLLKQIHNPYLSTPRSIDDCHKSVLPSDANNPYVLAWLDRLQASVQIERENLQEISVEALGQLPHDQQCNLSARSKVQEHKEMSTVSTRIPDVPVVEFRAEWEAQEIAPRPGFRLGNSMGSNSTEILILGIVTLEDAENLFDIFYTYIHPLVALLDPVLLTPQSTLARCPVLFTVICAIASRYHHQKSNIYSIAMHFAKCSAADALVLDGMKSVELCQAYILMSIYPAPERSWDRDQTWIYIGLAVSIATALRLNQTPKFTSVTKSEEREYLNRVRVWRFCVLLYQGIAIQVGKPSSWMMDEHMIIRHSGEWYRQSLYNLVHDVYLCGYNVLVLIVARFHEEVLLDRNGFTSSLRRNHLRDLAVRYDREIENFEEEWKNKFKVGGAHRGAMLRRSELHFYVAYFRLVIFSFGFHRVYQAGIETWYDYFFTKCFKNAKLVIRCMNEDLVPSGFMRYAPDRQFMCVAFAVAFLIKLLRPEFSSLLDRADKDESVGLIRILIDKFSSSDIAVDDQHSPKVYARFWATALGKYRHSGEGAAFEGSQTVIPENTGAFKSVAGETNKESSDNWRISHVAQGYDFAGVTYWQEAPHAMSSRPIQVRTDADLLHTMDGSQNINGNGWVEGQPRNIENKMVALVDKHLDNPGWMDGVLMPGFTGDTSQRRQVENYVVPVTNHYEMIQRI
ncbi:hypothetical protein EDD18DRAFT_1139337 [Armillaria luteobubalina]|uniref:Zn(2)-C6 fungal-type domain-containing protein n=1 Tax=Armillaria luteobubalina TaxID=153913 RepID=A0AA39UT14_9AGAR|nr:hypothetical protein EDD18DRAFT_1139337 [Armillaria luteobubalina]